MKLVHAASDKALNSPTRWSWVTRRRLCSPHFPVLTERIAGSGRENRAVLDDYAVASRLSYFLWSSLPDQKLLELAGKGRYENPKLPRRVERLLNDPKAHRFTTDFAGQWLDLRNINATSPDPETYGEFDDFLFWSMPCETEQFFEEVVARPQVDRLPSTQDG